MRQMLGSYPSLSLHDPETYMAGMVRLLLGYPGWAGDGAVKRAIGSDECKFSPPTQGVLRPLLEDEVRVHRYAEDWNRGAAQLALPPPPCPSTDERQAHIAKLREKYGPTFGIASLRRQEPTQAEARAELVAAIGQEAFDAMPDAGYDWKKLVAPKVEAAE